MRVNTGTNISLVVVKNIVAVVIMGGGVAVMKQITAIVGRNVAVLKFSIRVDTSIKNFLLYGLL